MHFDAKEFNKLLAQLAQGGVSREEALTKLNQSLMDKIKQLESAEAGRLEQFGKFLKTSILFVTFYNNKI